MNEVFVVRLNLTFANGGISEMAFSNYDKAVKFFADLEVDFTQDGYTFESRTPRTPPSIPIRKYLKMTRPSKTVEGGIDSAVITIKRLDFFK